MIERLLLFSTLIKFCLVILLLLGLTHFILYPGTINNIYNFQQDLLKQNVKSYTCISNWTGKLIQNYSKAPSKMFHQFTQQIHNASKPFMNSNTIKTILNRNREIQFLVKFEEHISNIKIVKDYFSFVDKRKLFFIFSAYLDYRERQASNSEKIGSSYSSTNFIRIVSASHRRANFKKYVYYCHLLRLSMVSNLADQIDISLTPIETSPANIQHWSHKEFEYETFIDLLVKLMFEY